PGSEPWVLFGGQEGALERQHPPAPPEPSGLVPRAGQLVTREEVTGLRDEGERVAALARGVDGVAADDGLERLASGDVRVRQLIDHVQAAAGEFGEVKHVPPELGLDRLNGGRREQRPYDVQQGALAVGA